MESLSDDVLINNRDSHLYAMMVFIFLGCLIGQFLEKYSPDQVIAMMKKKSLLSINHSNYNSLNIYFLCDLKKNKF